MTFRTDVSVDWTQSPRLIFVAQPAVNISIQDLIDTLRVLEEQPWEGLAYPHIIDAAGKENLGNNIFVGITAKLLNAKLGFESRKTSLTSGTVSSDDLSGFTLNDSSAQFITNGATQGAWVVNFTDGSRATILKVVSETQIITDGLGDGTDNQFSIGDYYELLGVVQCEINGGNLVAVESDGITDMIPIIPTVGTQIIRTSASSATLTDQQLQIQQQFLIESLRKDHHAGGEIFYWNPELGDDLLDGTLPNKARKTFASIHDNLIVSDRGDVVFIIRGTSSSVTVTERITISKGSVFVRAPGNTSFLPATAGGPTITITGNNSSISGVTVYNFGGGHPAIRASGGNLRIENSQVISSTGNGIEVLGGSSNFLERVLVRGCANNGILLSNTILTTIESAIIRDNVGYGVKLEASSPGSCAITILDHGICQNNATGGISIGAGVVSTTTTDNFYVALNAQQPIRISDSGIYSDENEKNRIDRTVDSIWDEPKANHTTSGTLGKEIATNKDVITAQIVFK